MSELITRRTFLKATGAAALVAAAGSMLVGCGDGAYASTPENLVAPPIDNSDFANFGSFTADIGPLSGSGLPAPSMNLIPATTISTPASNWIMTAAPVLSLSTSATLLSAIPLAALVRYVVLDTKV